MRLLKLFRHGTTKLFEFYNDFKIHSRDFHPPQNIFTINIDFDIVQGQPRGLSMSNLEKTVRLGAHLQLFVLKQFVLKMDHISLNETSHTSNFLVSLKTKEIGFFRYNETILFSKSFKCAPSLTQGVLILSVNIFRSDRERFFLFRP